MTDERTPFERDVIETLCSDVERASLTGCHPSLEVLLDCMSGELPHRERTQVLGHCARCAVCRERRAAIAASLEARLAALCGKAPSWSFAAWHTRAARERARLARWGRVAAAWAGATAAVCLGLGVWEALRPAERLVPRGGTAGGLSGLAVGLFAAAGLLLAAIGLFFARRRRRR